MSSVSLLHHNNFDFTSQNMMAGRVAVGSSSRASFDGEALFVPANGDQKTHPKIDVFPDENYVLGSTRREREPDLTQKELRGAPHSIYDYRTDTNREGVYQIAVDEVAVLTPGIKWTNPRKTLEQVLDHGDGYVIARIDGPEVVLEKWMNGRIDAFNAHVDKRISNMLAEITLYNKNKQSIKELAAKLSIKEAEIETFNGNVENNLSYLEKLSKLLPAELKMMVLKEIAAHAIQRERSLKEKAPVSAYSDLATKTVAQLRAGAPHNPDVSSQQYFQAFHNQLQKNLFKDSRLYDGYAKDGALEWKKLVEFYREIDADFQEIMERVDPRHERVDEIELLAPFANDAMNTLFNEMIAKRRQNRIKNNPNRA